MREQFRFCGNLSASGRGRILLWEVGEAIKASFVNVGGIA